MHVSRARDQKHRRLTSQGEGGKKSFKKGVYTVQNHRGRIKKQKIRKITGSYT